MELDVLKLHTTWNDAANSINTNFSKIQMAIASLGTGGGGLNEDELRAFLVVYLAQNGYATKDDIDNAISDIINGAPSTLDTLKEIADALAESDEIIVALNNAIGTKASKEELNEGLNTLANSKITISGVDVSLGGEITQQELRTGLGLETIVDWYNRVGVAFGKKGDGTYFVDGDFLANGQFAAAAVGAEGGSSVGATYLADLYDVSLGSLLSGDILSWNGSEWVNIKQSSLVPDLSGYATQSDVTSALSNYLPKTGGTISYNADWGLKLSSLSGSSNYLWFEGIVGGSTNLLGALGMGSYNGPVYVSPTGVSNTLLHSGNYSDYALPLSGGRISGNLDINSETDTTRRYFRMWYYASNRKNRGMMSVDENAVNLDYYSETDSRYDYISIGRNGFKYSANYVVNDVLHSGNYSDYALPLSGGKISGSYADPLIVNTSNASSIEFKLQINGNSKSSYVWDAYNGVYLYSYPSKKFIGIMDDGTPYYYDSAHNTLLHSGNYSQYALPLSGGTISGNLTLGGYLINNGHFLFARDIDNAEWVVTDKNWQHNYDILHSGNFGYFALPLSGGTLSSNHNILKLDGTSDSWVSFSLNGVDKTSVGYSKELSFIANDVSTARIGVNDSGIPLYKDAWNGTEYTLIHSGNIGSQRVDYATSAGNANSLNGISSGNYAYYSPDANGAYLAFNINDYSFAQYGQGDKYIEYYDNGAYYNSVWGWVMAIHGFKGNADSATKLATPRTIWGQSFDGTGNVDGSLSLGNNSIQGGSSVDMLYYDTSNTLYLGYGMCGVGGSVICGNAIAMRYGSSRVMGFFLNTSGNVTIGDSDLATSVNRFFVHGGAISGDTWADAGQVMLVSSNTYYLALTTNESGYSELQSGQRNVGAKPLVLQKKGGNVLIGTTTDRGHRLTVGRPDGAANLTSTTLNNSLLFVGMSESVYSYGTNFWTEGSGNGFIQQGRTDEEQPALYDLILQPFGRNVGICTPNPQYTLDVNGNVGFGTTGGCDVYLKRTTGFNYINAAHSFAVTVNNNTSNIAMYIEADKATTFDGTLRVTDTLTAQNGIVTNEITIGGIKLDVYNGALRVNGDIFSTGQFAASVAGEATGGSNIVLDYASIVNALGYTPADNNNLAQVAFTGSYADLSNKPTSLPASDVYSWAKASAKPTYSWSEIQSRPDVYTKQEVDDKLSEIEVGGGEGCNCDENVSGLGDTIPLSDLNGNSYDVPNGVNCVMVYESATLDFSSVIPLDPSRPCIMYLVKTDDYTLQVNFSSKIEAANSNGGLVSQFSVDGYTGMMLVWDTDDYKWWAYIQRM